MRHRISGKKLGRDIKQRQALFRSQVKSFFTYGRIETTHAKVKAIIPLVEKLCASINKGDLASTRLFFRYFQDRQLTSQVVSALKQSFPGQESNFTKTTKVRQRLGDQSIIVRLALVKPYQLPSSKIAPVDKVEAKEVKKTVKKVVKKVSKK